MEQNQNINTNEPQEQKNIPTNQQYNQNNYQQPQVRYIPQPSYMSLKAIGTWFGILLGFLGMFCVFAWHTPEERKEYASSYIIGYLIGIILKVAIIAVYILIIFRNVYYY